MGDTSETNTKVLSRKLFLGVVALKRLYRKIIICAIRSPFPNQVTFYWSILLQLQTTDLSATRIVGMFKGSKCVLLLVSITHILDVNFCVFCFSVIEYYI